MLRWPKHNSTILTHHCVLASQQFTPPVDQIQYHLLYLLHIGAFVLKWSIRLSNLKIKANWFNFTNYVQISLFCGSQKLLKPESTHTCTYTDQKSKTCIQISIWQNRIMFNLTNSNKTIIHVMSQHKNQHSSTYRHLNIWYIMNDIWVSPHIFLISIPWTHSLVCIDTVKKIQQQFSSVQNGISALRKAHICSTSSLRSFPKCCFLIILLTYWRLISYSPIYRTVWTSGLCCFWNVEWEAQTGMCQCSTSTFKKS